MRSGWMRGSIFWVLLVWGRFRVSKTIIPEAQEHFLTPSARRYIHLFGGLGFRGPVRRLKTVRRPPIYPKSPGHLALAENLGCELWTADEKFHQSVGQEMGHVRWIGVLRLPINTKSSVLVGG